MIIPLVSENEWLAFFNPLPEWSPPKAPVVVLAPHPDDETLGAGGLIADLRRMGTDVTVISVTDGENAYAGEDHLGLVRKKEQASALNILGVESEKIIRLRLPDSSVQKVESRLEEQLVHVINSQAHVIAPWTGDFHPDHTAVGRAAVKIARQCGAALTAYFFWTWHQGTPETIANLPLAIYHLTPETLEKKLLALHCHRSQLMHEGDDPILPQALLAPVYRSFEVYLPVL